MDIFVVGSALIDIAIKNYSDFKLITKKGRKYISIGYGSKVETDDIEMHVGGSGRTVAVSLAELGHNVGLVGRLGDDSFGNRVFQDLRDHGVHTEYVKKVNEGKTGFSILFFAPDGERSIVVYRGQKLDMKPDHLKESAIKSAKMLVFTSVTSTGSIRFVSKAIKVAKTSGATIVANPSITMIRHRKRDLLRFLRQSDISIMNEDEIKKVTGKRELEAAMRKMNNMGVGLVVVTLGPRGSMVFDGDGFYQKKGYKVKIEDTTGCGDVFTAGFLHYFLKKKAIKEALDFANASGALQCKKIGSQALSDKEVRGLMRRHPIGPR